MKGQLYTSFKTYDDIPRNENGHPLFTAIRNYTDTADEGSDYLCSITYGVYNREAYILEIIYTQKPMNDLTDIKELIDAYDKVFSGFLNDLEDIQELIFIITNYGGESDNALQILQEMKSKKVINVESDGADDKSGISTLAIEIPVEARKEMLTITRKAIFEQGMGIDPDPQNFGNSSGVALKFLYSLLELKTGFMETEFRISFNRLIRAILRFYGKTAKMLDQRWTRTSVVNEAERADIAQKSKNVISDETIVRNHPWVENSESELKKLKAQREALAPAWDIAPSVRDDGDGEE